jgi:hypothetical protein
MKIDEEESQAVYFFVNNVKLLCLVFNNGITWRLHLEIIKANAFRTFIKRLFLIKK